MLKLIFIANLLVLSASLVMAQAYRWVDDNGVVHFSDRPHPNAELISLPSVSGHPKPVVPPASPGDELEQTAPSVSAISKYESIEIISPVPEETLWNLEGVLNVALRITPSLQIKDRIRVYFDGNEVLMTSSMSFAIEEVWRGVHNIQAEIIDATGKVITRSLPNRFYVQQNRIIVPPK